MDTSIPRVLLSIALAALLPIASPNKDGLAKEDVPHSRQKRILWITNDGRLALPPGTSMTISPSLSMPFVRHPPKGFLSNVTISFPFTSKFPNHNFVLMCNTFKSNSCSFRFHDKPELGTIRYRAERKKSQKRMLTIVAMFQTEKNN